MKKEQLEELKGFIKDTIHEAMNDDGRYKPDDLLNEEEAAVVLGVKSTTVRHYRYNEGLEYVKTKPVKYKYSHLTEFVEKKSNQLT